MIGVWENRRAGHSLLGAVAGGCLHCVPVPADGDFTLPPSAPDPLDERAHGWVPKGATVFGPTWPHTPQASSRAVSSRAIQLPNVKRLAVVGLHPCTSLPNGDRSRFSQTAAALAKISFRGPAATGRVRPDRDVRGILRAIFWEFLEKTSRITSGTGLSPSEATSCRRTGTTSSPVGRPQPGGPPPGPSG